MYRIVKKEALKPTVTLYEIEAPMVAKKAEPGRWAARPRPKARRRSASWAAASAAPSLTPF